MAKLHYQQTGSGQDLILIHGLFGSLENLNMVAKPLSQDFRVTSVDVRNHGLSPHKVGMSYPELALDVLELMDELSIEAAVVLGHSMGGKIAMQLALDNPERVKKLIVADISPVSYPPHHYQIIDGLKSISLGEGKTRKTADSELSSYVEDAGIRSFLLQNLAVTDGKLNFKCHLNNISDGYPEIMQAYQGNNSYAKPCLFVKGGNSDYIKTEHSQIIGQLFPHSKAKIIQGAGHWLHAEKTVAFNKVIKDFILEV